MDVCSTMRLNSSCNGFCILISTSCEPDIPFVVLTFQLFTVATEADWPTELLLKAHIYIEVCQLWLTYAYTDMCDVVGGAQGKKWRPEIVIQHNNMVKSTIKCKAYSWRIDELFICTRIQNHNADSNSKLTCLKNCVLVLIYLRGNSTTINYIWNTFRYITSRDAMHFFLFGHIIIVIANNFS